MCSSFGGPSCESAPMKTLRLFCRCCCLGLILSLVLFVPALGITGENSTPEVGIAVRDITPELPIRLAGYAGRKQAADKLDHPLLVQALALKNGSGERFVFVALDNCEVSRAFMQPRPATARRPVPTGPRRGRRRLQPHPFGAGAGTDADRHGPAAARRIASRSPNTAACCGPNSWKWSAPRWPTASRQRSSTAWAAPPSP